ncbi:hypothetical protein SAMN06297358_0303 [Pedobacter xixiisoli]|uniref:Uncharacterized protein n=1 Tax=Pedobacter xixiisoli TaxID=1476464 RepID=A0A285ZQ31_9SPHI|nr:hypothetical protein [Pedobacter xixiisoli]SOD11728.1 hypothetical protein SAMN06297358_0303 [Pedobacter xixiisoli]
MEDENVLYSKFLFAQDRMLHLTKMIVTEVYSGKKLLSARGQGMCNGQVNVGY